MRTVKVGRSELLEKVKANRAKHKATVDKALAQYRAEAVEQLDRMIADARAGRRIVRSLDLLEPMDMTREYDRVIAMLEMSMDQTIELTAAEFTQYVLDQWHWMDQFAETTLNYANKRA